MKCSMCGEKIKYGMHYFITKNHVLCNTCGTENKAKIKHMANMKNISGRDCDGRDMEGH